MTVKQKQLLLAWFDLLAVEDVDGIQGAITEEATRQLQRKLNLTPDGIWGYRTDAAVREYIFSGEDLTEESVAADINVGGNEDGSWWDEIEFFSREEFRCQCGGKYCDGFPAEPQEKLVRTVDEIRRRLGVPVRIVDAGGSGVRCPQHNADVGGVWNSDHVTGNAADLHSDASPQEMARIAEEVMGHTGQIGIYSWGIHVGINEKYSRYYG